MHVCVYVCVCTCSSGACLYDVMANNVERVNVLYHGESNVCSLESWSIVDSVSYDSHHLLVLIDPRTNDSIHQVVLISWARAGKNSKSRPHFVHFLLVYLSIAISDSFVELLVIQHQ